MFRVPEEVASIARDIKGMKIRGAGKIARAGAEALKIAAQRYEGPTDPERFKGYMEQVARYIVSTRPTAVSLPNAVAFVMKQLREAAGGFRELVDTVVRAADDFIRNSLRAVETIGRIGARMLRSGDTVLTHCHSTAALSILVTAKKTGREIKVYTTETRPKFQGRITYKQLVEAGVEAIQIPDSAVRSIMKRVDKVVVGADTITSDGALINKVGTSQVALAAHEARVRLFVAAETYKFSPASVHGVPVLIEERPPDEVVPAEWLKRNPGVKIRNPAFDVTPPEYIDAIITEVGVIPPKAAAIVLRELFGYSYEAEKLVLVAAEHDEAGVYY